MAIFIPIRCVRREGGDVYYEYSQPVHTAHPTKPNRTVEVGENVGVVCLNLETLSVSRVSGQDWDDGVYFVRVQARLLKHLREEGTIPDVTCYAA
jgi:hypothetical protein